MEQWSLTEGGKQGHVDCSADYNQIINCYFEFLDASNLKGGGIYLSNRNFNLLISGCSFLNCSATEGGGIYASCDFIEIYKVCGVNCSNRQNYGTFANLKSNFSLNAQLITATQCEGDRATIYFSGPRQTLKNINSTYNTVYQEGTFITIRAEYSVTKFVESTGNINQYLGLNFHYGTSYIGSKIHYHNCSILGNSLERNSTNHIQCHICEEALIFDSYIDVDNQYTFGIIDAKLTIYNVEIPGLLKINGQLTNITNDLPMKDTATEHFLFLNTYLCPAEVPYISKCKDAGFSASSSSFDYPLFTIFLLAAQ